MSNLKILMLNHEFPPVGGGAAPVTMDLCKFLVKAGHHVDVVTMHFGDLPKFQTINGVNIYRTPALRKRPNICYTHEMATYLPGAIKKTLQLCRHNKYDIIHCHFIIPGGPLALLVSKLTKIPYIITAHGSDVPGFNTDRFQWQHKFTKPLLKAVCKNAKHITCPSNYLKELIKQNIGRFEIEKIPNGIDLEDFSLDLSLPKENIILATGRLLKRKGFQTLINAVHDIQLPFDVHIVGEGPFRNQLEYLAKDSKTKIIFHGWLNRDDPHLINFYQRASIYILASQKENASISLLEGMAAKCAVITTNVSGCPETVGEAGLLIDFNDVEKLKEILINLSQNPQLIKEYSQKAYNRIIEKFLWQNIAEDYVKLYREVIKKGFIN